MSTQQGSSVLCIMITTGILLLLMSLVMRYTTYGIDIARQRVLHEQQYFALKGLLNYGLMIANTGDIADSIIMPINGWLNLYDGNITISAQENWYAIYANLFFTPTKFTTLQQVVPKTKKA